MHYRTNTCSLAPPTPLCTDACTLTSTFSPACLRCHQSMCPIVCLCLLYFFLFHHMFSTLTCLVISYSCGKPPERHMFLHSPWVTVQLEWHLIQKSLSPHFYLLLNSFTTLVHPWPQPHTHKTPALHSQLPYCPPVILWDELSTHSHRPNWDL